MAVLANQPSLSTLFEIRLDCRARFFCPSVGFNFGSGFDFAMARW
ncbi:MAG: hypothetical protein ACLP8S_27470 [Solirubrobacteraceae bacterium]